MNFTKTLAICAIGLSMACSQKNMQETAMEEVDVPAKEMEMDGFMEGTVVEFKSLKSPCNFQIKINETLTIEALEFPRNYMVDGLPVWVKYSMQRRPQNCGTSQPVEILEIKKRGKPSASPSMKGSN